MKYFFLAITFLSTNVFGQINTEEVTRRVANHIIETTSFQFVNTKTNEKFAATTGRDTSVNVKAESKFNKWQYVNGVMTVGMLRLSSVLNDTKYADYSKKNFNFIFSNLDYFKKQFDAGRQNIEYRPVFRIGSLDDCGSMAAGLLDVYALDKRADYLAYLQRVGDYIINQQVKFTDGTLARNGPRKMTLWADDLYMSVPYLARMGKLTGDNKYFDFAIKQVENFNRYIYDSTTGLYFHCFYNDENMNGVARWGRCNGWVAVAQAELLNNLPANHPKRPELIKLLLRQIVGFSRYQDPGGLWHQVLDRPDSYLESSVTAMFVYTVAKAVNEGWIPQRFISIAQNGWEALAKKVTADGQVPDICIGTSIEEDIRYYYTRPTELNDTHGLGAFLMAGAEIIKAKDKLVDMSRRR
ncbi:MAG: glycoside hydrolase family 88 protein [Chitinophagaceae bacterium]